MSDLTPEPEAVSSAGGPAIDPATRAVMSGRRHHDGALSGGVQPSTTFEIGSIDDARRLATQVKPTHFYQRYGNPTVADFEDAIADLEGAQSARAFASGMAAISATVLALCSQGSHIVASRQLYGGTRQLLEMACPRFGIDVTFADGTEAGALAGAVEVGRTSLVLVETPANPRLDLVDLTEVGNIAGPFTVVDSTFATPLGQQPINHGVDLVIHSASKAIAGNNDTLLGVVAGERDLVDWITGFAHLHGGCASPTAAQSGLRGLRTLPLRLAHQSASAVAVAAFLENHPAVSHVRQPGLPSHPQYHLAAKQMSHTGGLVSADLTDADAVRRLVERLAIVRHAPSLGGPETLICHPASTTHVGVDPVDLAVDSIGPGTIRLSLGLEDATDVIADLARALD